MAVTVIAGGKTVGWEGDGADFTITPVESVATPDDEPTYGWPGLEDRGARWFWFREHGLIADFVGTATFDLDAKNGLIKVAAQCNDALVEHLVLDHLVSMYLASTDRIVVHGALVSKNGCGVILHAPSGTGKSTTAAYLEANGWALHGDDGVVVHGSPPLAQATYGSLRLLRNSLEMLDINDAEYLTIGKSRPRTATFTPGEVPLKLVVAMERDGDRESSLDHLGGVDAWVKLVQACFVADVKDPQHRQQQVDQSMSVIGDVAVARLKMGDGVDGLQQAEALLAEAIGQRAETGERTMKVGG